MRLFVRDRDFYKRFFTMTLTLALQNAVVFAVNLADNVMLGRYAEPALSGVALVNQLQYLLQMLVMGIGEGIVVLASRSWGRRELGTVRSLAGIGMRLSLLVAFAMGAVVLLFPRGVLSLFSTDGAVLSQGAAYLVIICFSYPFFAATTVLLAVLRSVETVKIGFFLSLSTLLTNVLLNYMLIFGRLGAPELGVRGAAIATLAARVIETGIAAAYALRLDRKIGLRLRDFARRDRALFKSYLRIGSPVLLSNAIWGLAMAVQTAILGHMGSAAIAANSIATTLFQILTVVAYGAGSAAGVLTGKTIGEGDRERVRRYAVTMQALFLLIGVVTGALLFLCRGPIVAFYRVAPETERLTLQFIGVLSVTAVGTSYQAPVLTGIVRGGGDTKFVLINDMIFMWGLVLPLSAAAAFWWRLPALAVFIFLKSDQVLKCLVAVVKVNRGKWVKSFQESG